ncbi:MAG TPA: hypothetical protein VD713_02555 [Sphingomonadales bacterium]|nr:hypothetical protein [Sphingomonadales bacterium]
MAHTPLDTTDFSRDILKKVSYTHDAMIDAIIANPAVSEIELAAQFGFSKPWVNRLICSDAFQARLALRKEELIDPGLTASAEERIRNLEFTSMEIVQEKLEATADPKLAMQVLEMTFKARAYGARGAGQGAITQNNYVVALPQPVKDAAEWAKQVTGEVLDGNAEQSE